MEQAVEKLGKILFFPRQADCRDIRDCENTPRPEDLSAVDIAPDNLA
jgi:hypothetical protein